MYHTTLKGGRSRGTLHSDRRCKYIRDKADDELISGARTRFDDEQEICGKCGPALYACRNCGAVFADIGVYSVVGRVAEATIADGGDPEAEVLTFIEGNCPGCGGTNCRLEAL